MKQASHDIHTYQMKLFTQFNRLLQINYMYYDSMNGPNMYKCYMFVLYGWKYTIWTVFESYASSSSRSSVNWVRIANILQAKSSKSLTTRHDGDKSQHTNQRNAIQVNETQ